MWMTFSNLNDWFDAWEMLCLDHGFAVEGDWMNNSDEMELLFSDEQKCRIIINMDETKFSLDGSNGGIGGRPANVISARGVVQPGTAQNKSSSFSTLMCASSAAGELLPIHLMFACEDETFWSMLNGSVISLISLFYSALMRRRAWVQQ